MNNTENKDEHKNLITDNRAELIQLLSGKFQSKLSLVVSLIGSGIAAYGIRSLGIHSIGGLILSLMIGLSLSVFVDLVRLQIRVAKALELVKNECRNI